MSPVFTQDAKSNAKFIMKLYLRSGVYVPTLSEYLHTEAAILAANAVSGILVIDSDTARTTGKKSLFYQGARALIE